MQDNKKEQQIRQSNNKRLTRPLSTITNQEHYSTFIPLSDLNQKINEVNF